MKNIILLLFILLIFISCKKKQTSYTKQEIERTILSLEQKALDLFSSGDPNGYIINFSNDATYFDDIEAFTRLDSLSEIKKYFTSLNGKVIPHSYKIIDPKVQIYGEIAILTLSYDAKTNDGNELPQWKATSVYRLIKGDWKVVHAHWSLIKDDNS